MIISNPFFILALDLPGLYLVCRDILTQSVSLGVVYTRDEFLSNHTPVKNRVGRAQELNLGAIYMVDR